MTIYNSRVDENRKAEAYCIVSTRVGMSWRSGLVRIFFLKDEAVLWARERDAD